MIIDGRKIADAVFDELKGELGTLTRVPTLGVLTSNPSFETRKFLSVKRRKAEMLGIKVEITELASEVTTEEAVRAVNELAQKADGIVVQLPFPPQVDNETLISAISQTHDVDAFNLEDEDILPPVVGAISEIIRRNNIDVKNKNCVVIGNGRLVGGPTAIWLRRLGAEVKQLTKESENIEEATQNADIIVLGAGVPGLLKPSMVKEGVVILDAGTSEASGKLVGDADPACAEKASLFTPVPGGIGPITIAVLLKNLITLMERNGAA
jgi:methylenetetrahydrofolate dehydrogenase (NADP+)/methenyltetrahydrofolate cyclohydrolase